MILPKRKLARKIFYERRENAVSSAGKFLSSRPDYAAD